MASSSSQRMIHQDYIARIRYSNALPPPPNPPKLLDIPNTGLSSGQYTTPGFASRLARDQAINIEADAELGMPLDLVGMPGIFDGDESSIQAPLHPPAVHPHDRPLLRALSSLGKPKFSDAGVSFLRRTEYISSYSTKGRIEKSKAEIAANKPRRPPLNLDKESPAYIKSQAIKSFETAANYLKNPATIRHPTKPTLKLVDANPLIPDHNAFPDAGGYVALKFLNNPMPPGPIYDLRLENSLLAPMALDPLEEEARSQARELHERDPSRYPAPDDTIEYEFFMTDNLSDAMRFKRKFDVLDPECDSEDLYTAKNGSNQPCIRFKRIRAYESAFYGGSLNEGYSEEVVIGVHDGTDGLRQKAAYYYPLVQKISIRPQRTKNINIKKMRYNQEDIVKRQTDFVDVRVLPPDDNMQAERDVFRMLPYGRPEEDGEDEGQSRKGSQAPDGSENGDKDAEGDDDSE